jgi:Flp pilus assembly protein TadD
MPRCFSCGSHVSALRFTCPACEGVGIMRDARQGTRDLAYIQQRGFEQLTAGLSNITEELSNLAGVLEWGFEEIKWEQQQQTGVLLSIDHTLKNPSQTQAHEWRRMAEELSRRGCLSEAEQWFQKALAEDPLDYQTYIGLAMVYLRNNEFDKARDILEKSLPHAPTQAIGSSLNLLSPSRPIRE